jgi:hypothetical protein
MKRDLIILMLGIMISSCQTQNKVSAPEPHLELGQRISFQGSNPEKSYIIIGYRKDLNSKVDKDWANQEYIVFVYINDHNDVKEATIHKNSITKQ